LHDIRRILHRLYVPVAVAAMFLRASAECFVRLSHRLGVCPSVCHTHELYQNGAS